MKGSAVVNGFRALASRIHEQLPLSPRESQRLLTALTSSFRKHLDEVHPKTANEELRPKSSNVSSTPNIENHATYSSAALADKHLASVLTSPLLARSASTSTSASQLAGLEAKFADCKDPIALLESYELKSRVTPAAVELCLKRFQEISQNLSPSERATSIQKSRFGTRLLGCFWRASIHESVEFVDHSGLRESLVWAVMSEGRDDLLWDWLKMDLKLRERDRGEDKSSTRFGHVGSINLRGKAFDDYRWKGRVIRAMVVTMLEAPFADNKCADAAIRVYLKAHRIRAESAGRGHMRWLPLEPARVYLVNKLCYRSRPWKKTDLNLYQALIDSINGRRNALLLFQETELWLYHPTRPTAEPLYQVMRDIYAESPSLDLALQARGMIEGERSYFHASKMHYMLLLASTRLKATGEEEKAGWLLAFAREHFPAQQRFHEKDMKEIMEFEDIEMPRLQDDGRVQNDSEEDMANGASFPFTQPL